MSLTISGLVLMVLSVLAQQAGYDLHLNEGSIDTTLTTLTQVAGLLMAWYGRVRQGNVTWYGRKV